MARAYWHEEQAGEFSTTSSIAWGTALTLSATLPGGARYAIFWSARCWPTDTIGDNIEIRLHDGTNQLGFHEFALQEDVPQDQLGAGGIAFIDATGGDESVTLNIEARCQSGAAEVFVDNGSIVILELTDDDKYETDDTTYTITTTEDETILSLDLSPLQSGEYLVLGGFNCNATGSAYFRMTIDAATTYTETRIAASVTTTQPVFRAIRTDLPAGDHTIRLVGRGLNDPTSQPVSMRRLLALRIEDDIVHYAQAKIAHGDDSTAFRDILQLQAATAAGDHFIISDVMTDPDASTGASEFVEFVVDDVVGVDFTWEMIAAPFDVRSWMNFRVENLTEATHTWKWRRRWQNPGVDSLCSGSIIVLQLFDQTPIVVTPEIPVARESVYVVDMTVAPVDLDPSFEAGESSSVGFGAVGMAAVGAPVTAGLLPVYDDPTETVEHFADRDWTTIPADGAAVFHDGRAAQPLEFERTIPLDPFNAQRNTFGVGRITLANADRGLRDLAKNYSIDGREIDILVGSLDASKSTFERLFRGVMDFWSGDTGEQLIVNLRDRWRRLTIDPRPLFRGTGGIDGPPELQDKPVPMLLGYGSNVPCVFITNDPMPIYMVSGYPADTISAVRVRAGDIAIDSSTTDIFNASTPSAGTALICPHNVFDNRSYVGFASQPDGPVTVSARGLTVGGLGGAYLSRTTDIAKWLINTLAGVPASDIDIGAWQTFRRRWTGEIGAWFGTEPVSVLNMMAAIMNPASWWGDDSEGRITCGSLDLPSFMGTPNGSLSEDEIIAFERVDWPVGPPWKRTSVLYDLNYFVQNTDLADATAEWLAYIKETGRVYGADNVPVRTAHPGALAPDPIPLPFRLLQDAADVQQIVARMNSGDVDLWRATTADIIVRFPLGHLLYLDHPMASDGQIPAVVVGTTFNAAERQAIYLLIA